MFIFPHWNHKAGETVKVLTVTNCDSCELFLNGKSLGVKQYDPVTPCLWDVMYEPGTLRAVGFRNGSVAAEYEVKTAGQPCRLILEPHKNAIKNDEVDAIAVNVSAVDKDGNPCPDADELIKFSISGGKILGVGNGNPASHEKDFASERKLYHGKCQAVISCNQGAEQLNFTAEADGMISAELNLEIITVPPAIQLESSDSRIIDSWKISSRSYPEKPNPNIRIDWSENNAFVSVNMSSERLQDLEPGWMLYRADIAIPNSAGKDVPATVKLGSAKYLECEIWINGKKYSSDKYETDTGVIMPEISFHTGGAENVQITILLKTGGGKAGLNGRDKEISIVCG